MNLAGMAIFFWRKTRLAGGLWSSLCQNQLAKG
jgi:hypothetical protein